MRILLLCWRDTGHPEGGGSERYLEHVAGALAAAGHRVVYRTAAYPGAAAAERRGGVAFSRAGGGYTVYPRAWAAMAAARLGHGPLARALGGRPEVVLDTQNGIPFLARIFAGAPTVLLVHHCHREQWPVAGRLTGRLGWFIESRLSPQVHRGCRYITVSEPSAADLRALGVRGSDIEVIRNGVDPVPAGAAAAAAPADPGPRLVTLSRLVPHKQIEHAIDAVAALAPRWPGLRLDVIGDGWWADRLRGHARALGVADRVVFHGQVTEERKHALLAAARVHLMPSRKEGWGLAVIEAAQHAVPTVGYRSSAGLRDSVVDGATGLLAGTPAELVAAVGRLLADPGLRDRLGAAARRRAGRFSWPATTAAVERVLVAAARRR
ncbi:glycosyl transferase [Corynebacterium sphenisci DSM 44792]|uniref:Glycosyl transferase n=1 Tax=Corynebacterium sphenisci DSM 44792 TaxID=1437874 RepID=A0A1L7D069_9CORY|nr:glycosyltransferase family 4 protein [Corynebacterium sphenisci]APT91484.1 glycosyl transferase [Corynebacterium sphenisci DSM 44792]